MLNSCEFGCLDSWVAQANCSMTSLPENFEGVFCHSKRRLLWSLWLGFQPQSSVGSREHFWARSSVVLRSATDSLVSSVYLQSQRLPSDGDGFSQAWAFGCGVNRPRGSRYLAESKTSAVSAPSGFYVANGVGYYRRNTNCFLLDQTLPLRAARNLIYRAQSCDSTTSMASAARGWKILSPHRC